MKKTAIISGETDGIGKGAVLQLLEDGFNVATFSNGEFYSATKFAVMGYSEGLRKELADYKIKVATICPGMIKTNFFTKEELEKRKKVWEKDQIQMLEVEDINRIISLICNQSEHCDVQDITIMPF